MREERREETFPPPSPAARRRKIPGERREVLRGAAGRFFFNSRQINIYCRPLNKENFKTNFMSFEIIS
jgi:hypothetical protein